MSRQDQDYDGEDYHIYKDYLEQARADAERLQAEKEGLSKSLAFLVMAATLVTKSSIQHAADCRSLIAEIGGVPFNDHRLPCTCGLDALRKALSATEEGKV